MKIRAEQMEAFDKAAVRNFKLRMAQHLKESFPNHCQILGDEKLDGVIDYGWERAKSYGMWGENSVILFTDLMFLLGRGFDADPQLPWASKILNDKELADEETRTQTLYEKAIDYLNLVSGEKNEHIDAAQARIRDEKTEDFLAIATSTLPEQLLPRLKKIYPQKYEFVGEACLREMILAGMTNANNYGITDSRGLAVYIGLMYMLGAGFDADPLFSFAAEVLQNKAVLDQQVKTDRLYQEAMNYLSLWCAN